MEEKKAYGSLYCTPSEAELVKTAAASKHWSVTKFVTLAALDAAREIAFVDEYNEVVTDDPELGDETAP